MAHTINRTENEEKLQKALKLIKNHITEKATTQNYELHKAVQLIVDVVREYGYCER